MSKITLETQDKKLIEADLDSIKRSVVISNMFEDIGESDNVVPLPNVTSEVLAKVIEWCNHHVKDPLPKPEEDDIDRPSVDIKDWDRKFFDVTDEVVFDIILAANYLDIKQLLDIGCKTVADMFNGKSAAEIRKRFNIVSDFTPEEEEQVRKENEWAECR